MENNGLRISDKKHQLNFIIYAEPNNHNFSFTKPVHLVISGFKEVAILFNHTAEFEGNDKIPEMQRYKRQALTPEEIETARLRSNRNTETARNESQHTEMIS